MTLGKTPVQADLFRSTTKFCEPRVKADSIYALLHRECFALSPDELFADLFTDLGRRSVPPLIAAPGRPQPAATRRPKPYNQ